MKTASWWLSLVAFGRIILLCFYEASVGSTLFTLGNPYIMELLRCLIICMNMGVPFLVALCASALWYKNFISGLRSCENQPPWSWLIVELLPVFGWRNISGLFGNPFLWPTVFCWTVRVISWPGQWWGWWQTTEKGCWCFVWSWGISATRIFGKDFMSLLDSSYYFHHGVDCTYCSNYWSTHSRLKTAKVKHTKFLYQYPR